MIPFINFHRIIYIFSNLFVIPATLIPKFETLSNISFFISLFIFAEKNFLLFLLCIIIFILKNNANYRFLLLLEDKGKEKSKSDSVCVYFYAWLTFLRYLLLGIAINEIYSNFN
mgnify:CR=1 FL=1